MAIIGCAPFPPLKKLLLTKILKLPFLSWRVNQGFQHQQDGGSHGKSLRYGVTHNPCGKCRERIERRPQGSKYPSPAGKAFLKGYVSQIEIQGNPCKLKQRERGTKLHLTAAVDIAHHTVGMSQKRSQHQKKRRKQQRNKRKNSPFHFFFFRRRNRNSILLLIIRHNN